jgi:predicted RNA-binding protein associated with RNAse of E/G family
MDQMLDIVINPDRTKWHWKDEDEFSEAEEIGVYSREKAQSIRQEGQRVIGLLNANASPFCDGWENWTPPREWGIPVFPLGWENLPM